MRNPQTAHTKSWVGDEMAYRRRRGRRSRERRTMAMAMRWSVCSRERSRENDEGNPRSSPRCRACPGPTPSLFFFLRCSFSSSRCLIFFLCSFNLAIGSFSLFSTSPFLSSLTWSLPLALYLKMIWGYKTILLHLQLLLLVVSKIEVSILTLLNFLEAHPSWFVNFVFKISTRGFEKKFRDKRGKIHRWENAPCIWMSSCILYIQGALSKGML